MSEDHKILIHLGYAYLDMYRPEIFQFEMVFTLPVVRHMLLSIYSSMVGRKMIQAIEKLPAEVKEKLKQECREYTAGKPIDLSLEFVKCYWAMEQLAKMDEHSKNYV